MGRFDAFSTIIRLAFDSLGIQPRPWMAVVAVCAGGVLLFPSLRRNARTARARKLLVGLLDLDADQRRARADPILELVAGNPQGLISVTDQAISRGHRAIATRAYEALRRTPGAPRVDLLRLDEKLFGAPPHHAEAEVAAIERLLDVGALLRADERLRRARSWFPTDTGLQALEARLEDERARARGG